MLEPKVLNQGGLFIGGQRLLAVTKFTAQFQKPFDRDYWSQRKAKERGVTVATILAEWDKKRDEGRVAGASMHAYIEAMLTGNLSDPLGAMRKTPEMIGFDTFMQNLGEGLILQGRELPVGNKAWGLGGKVDAVFESEVTQQYHPFDWKRGAVETHSPFGDLIGPFEGINAAAHNFHSIQVWLYSMMLEHLYPDVNWGKPYIVGLYDNTYQALPASDQIYDIIVREEIWRLARPQPAAVGS